MKRIEILPFGLVPGGILRELREGLAREFAVPCEVLAPEPEPEFAFNLARRQYYSTQILLEMNRRPLPNALKILGVTAVDLYIPILTFVFGEAQMQGGCAVVSTHRLHQEFYGLPADPGLMRNRLLKEAVHELGHTLSLAHCEDYQCVMSPSHGVEWIDLKTHRLCKECRSKAFARGGAQAAL